MEKLPRSCQQPFDRVHELGSAIKGIFFKHEGAPVDKRLLWQKPLPSKQALVSVATDKRRFDDRDIAQSLN